ncbi:MAG: thioredoxin domain-containing protein [Sphingomonas sp.]|uniref:DsbA family protein n=1 Tax=Sphingomonas sp. TaxID=28214 RepID=UPI001AC2535C|nr:DsbA family protein [Sphingomonas sp.]MBN8807905.1 thioredoxin domain-containing protein [Sphingomonas sp.]
MNRWLSSTAALPVVAIVAALLGAAVTWVAARGDGSQVRDYLLEHPEVLPEAMQKLRDRETGKLIAANRADIVTPVGGAWAGNPNGDVTVVEYLDYNCGYCRASLPIVDKLIAADPKVKVIYRELPVLSPESDTAARYAIVAGRMGKYQALHNALYAGGPLSEASMDAALVKAGLDPAAVKAAAKSDDVTRAIHTNLAMMRTLGMTGTPSWVIGDRVVSSMMPLEDMQAAIATARAGNAS